MSALSAYSTLNHPSGAVISALQTAEGVTGSVVGGRLPGGPEVASWEGRIPLYEDKTAHLTDNIEINLPIKRLDWR